MLCMTLLKFQHDRVTQKKSYSKTNKLQELKRKVSKFGFQVIKTTDDKTNDWIVMERPCIT